MSKFTFIATVVGVSVLGVLYSIYFDLPRLIGCIVVVAGLLILRKEISDYS